MLETLFTSGILVYSVPQSIGLINLLKTGKHYFNDKADQIQNDKEIMLASPLPYKY